MINQDLQDILQINNESIVTRFLVTAGDGIGQLLRQVTNRLNTRVGVLFDSIF
jgi:hypothetical protein